MRRLWHRLFKHPGYRLAATSDGHLQARCTSCQEFFGLKFKQVKVGSTDDHTTS